MMMIDVTLASYTFIIINMPCDVRYAMCYYLLCYVELTWPNLLALPDFAWLKLSWVGLRYALLPYYVLYDFFFFFFEYLLLFFFFQCNYILVFLLLLLLVVGVVVVVVVEIFCAPSSMMRFGICDFQKPTKLINIYISHWLDWIGLFTIYFSVLSFNKGY